VHFATAYAENLAGLPELFFSMRSPGFAQPHISKRVWCEMPIKILNL
jgi:hypothetical protein